MTPTPAVRRFDARLRLLVDLHRLVRSLDGSDALTVLALAGIGGGITIEELHGPGLGLFAAGIVLAFMTPIGTAIRILIRGR